MTPEPPQLADAAALDRFRCLGLRLDRQGRFWHDGSEVTHPRLRQALLAWLDRTDDGRDIVRIDDQRFAYVDVEDAHLLVVSARWANARVLLTLNDGSEEELDYSSMGAASDNALYCRVRAGRLEARFMTAAYYALADELVEVGDDIGLRAAGSTHLIGTRERQ